MLSASRIARMRCPKYVDTNIIDRSFNALVKQRKATIEEKPMPEVLGNQGVSLPPLAVLLMTRERFAELSGVAPGVVDAWVDRGYLPSMLVGG